MHRGAKFLPVLFFILFSLTPPLGSMGFGFVAHRKINRLAVFTLPPEMVGFFKKNIEYLSEHAVDPDRKAFAIPGEAERHYIDIERYGSSPFDSLPRHWTQAIEKYKEGTLVHNGVLPWHIYLMLIRLTYAFEERDPDLILYQAAHIGHYIADACTPLHTTMHYNGVRPEQAGIHALWESRIPEMLSHSDSFDYLVGRAQLIEEPLERAWELVKMSHLMVDSIFQAYDLMLENFSPDQVFSYEVRGQALSRVYSREFTLALHKEMNQMVERQMRLAVKCVGDFWYTAWVNAGQPDLYALEDKGISRKFRKLLERERKEWEEAKEPAGRPNPE
ncbi:MAG: zinc dependent phospholipase C family protein [Bacteroides sp.]|jgi:hypothetical protein|nr:zinc dependent phospholipase C family protein [Bacteroides sp.]